MLHKNDIASRNKKGVIAKNRQKQLENMELAALETAPFLVTPKKGMPKKPDGLQLKNELQGLVKQHGGG